jgi:hypothetical protein
MVIFIYNIYIYNGILLSHRDKKTNEIIWFAGKIDGMEDHPAELDAQLNK